MDIMDIIMSKAIAKKYTASQLLGLAYSNVILEGVFEPDRTDIIETNITDIKPGDTVRVIWNGVQYMCVAYENTPYENTHLVIFGNTGYDGGINDGVPFIHIIYPDENGSLMSGFVEVAGLMTECGFSFDGSVSIKVFTETVHTENSGGGQPVVLNLDEWGLNLRTPIMAGGVRISVDWIDHKAFWESIPIDGNFKIKFDLLGNDIYINTSAVNHIWFGGDVRLCGFTCLTFADYGDMQPMSIYIQFSAVIDSETKEASGTNITIVVQPLSIPTA